MKKMTLLTAVQNMRNKKMNQKDFFIYYENHINEQIKYSNLLVPTTSHSRDIINLKKILEVEIMILDTLRPHSLNHLKVYIKIVDLIDKIILEKTSKLIEINHELYNSFY